MITEINRINSIIKKSNFDNCFDKIIDKIFSNTRIDINEALQLFESKHLSLLSCLATIIRLRTNGKNAYFIRNIHIEPTNICVFNCKFCSYSQTIATKQWDLSIEQIYEKLNLIPENINEIHITGGVHPDKAFNYYLDIAKAVKNRFPKIHLKAFSAVELDYIFKKEGLSIKEGIDEIKKAGVDSIPGGGAEIFDENIRNLICPEKVSSNGWLKIHKTAHNAGIPTNATMLYGHIEKYKHRVDHLNRLRKLQDETNGFNSFIPLKFRNANNKMSAVKEVALIEDLKNYAVSRIFLDNFPHIKAYWPAIGIDAAILSLSYGADDLDGTINNSTAIYSLAGAKDKKPALSVSELRTHIIDSGFIPVERNSDYKAI